ncbi:MAG TPA: glutamate-5-semialdehyde dehydrogenase [Verrucomicrobiales bacterium]|nr:glutamate-5-semialdehyde dehydrogenase [Verrucomicrobiales bacterium]
MTLKDQVHAMGRRAVEASRRLALLPAAQKNAILLAMAEGLARESTALLEANAKDLAAAKAKGLSGAMIDRLTLNPKRVAEMAQGVREVAALTDPVGEVLSEWTRPNGIRITKVRVPIGVIGIIYESRPNVTADAAVLCLKSGNATLLRGGSEAFHSNMAIAAVLQSAGEAEGLPPDSIQLIPFTDRESVQHMAEMDDCLDLIIPRGGKGLIETVVRLARMPVIKHYDGICHVYVDKAADLEMALRILINAKCQKPSACNAAETLLVHEAIAKDFYRLAVPELRVNGVELRGDESLRALFPDVKRATEEDYDTEYLELILSVKTVSGLEEALRHIADHSSRHTDVIITEDAQSAASFLNAVDSAVVLWNASTRFNDGGEFGFGCEIGISTDKLHARGPMGLPELTSYKYLVRGKGQARE